MVKANKTKKEIIDFMLVVRRLSAVLVNNYRPGDPIDIMHHRSALSVLEMLLDWMGVDYDD